MIMAAKGTTAAEQGTTAAEQGTTAAEHGEHHAHQEHEAPGKSQLVMVDLSRRQSAKQVKQLRKGHGSLVRRIDEIVEELVQSGTLKADAQPVVIVVREKLALPWPFSQMELDEDDDDDD
jgi:Family of unknown function (DUF6200)